MVSSRQVNRHALDTLAVHAGYRVLVDLDDLGIFRTRNGQAIIGGMERWRMLDRSG